MGIFVKKRIQGGILSKFISAHVGIARAEHFSIISSNVLLTLCGTKETSTCRFKVGVMLHAVFLNLHCALLKKNVIHKSKKSKKLARIMPTPNSQLL